VPSTRNNSNCASPSRTRLRDDQSIGEWNTTTNDLAADRGGSYSSRSRSQADPFRFTMAGCRGVDLPLDGHQRHGGMLEEFGELLPLKCEDPDLALYNPTRVIDALDEQASSIERFPGFRIMSIDRHVCRTELVIDVDVFKIPNLRVSPAYLSERFVARWVASGLEGLLHDEAFEMECCFGRLNSLDVISGQVVREVDGARRNGR
jgi:hypothetical protein